MRLIMLEANLSGVPPAECWEVGDVSDGRVGAVDGNEVLETKKC